MALLCVGTFIREWKRGTDATLIDLASAMFITTMPIVNTVLLLWIMFSVVFIVAGDFVLIKGKEKK